ncbi:hypothetical protein POVWA2_046280 [Plasmodium ovale wallikeri]|uniref:Uncharacterized protein n=1 Tax=Plasmodium ovale wallikeri TaxID=864142 RepID=A0A1A8ZH34_PLAOA|nr:hypothetical protein POVWA1_047350 [Plasmodium ovale wallikeri]SBT43634.1 hypothetical protein POVWA2_046280 [Plasmodium ovale wallikeri]
MLCTCSDAGILSSPILLALYDLITETPMAHHKIGDFLAKEYALWALCFVAKKITTADVHHIRAHFG